MNVTYEGNLPYFDNIFLHAFSAPRGTKTAGGTHLIVLLTTGNIKLRHSKRSLIPQHSIFDVCNIDSFKDIFKKLIFTEVELPLDDPVLLNFPGQRC